jgi:tripartite-type tricarboxylate transporter receptor subunit TctC
MMSFPRLLSAAIFAGATLAATCAGAQAWPDKPIKFIVPAPAGSSLDVLARIIGAGKRCQVYVTPQGATKIVRELGGKGFVLAVYGVGKMNEEEIKDLVRSLCP